MNIITGEDWEKIKLIIKKDACMTHISYMTWIDPLLLRQTDDNTVIISVPQDNTFAIQYINARYADYIKAAISEYVGEQVGVELCQEKCNKYYQRLQRMENFRMISEGISYVSTKGDSVDKKSIYTYIEDEILSMTGSEESKKKKLKRLEKHKKQKINIMLVGATGSGKSSTVNALFDMKLAKVGEGADPEAKGITEYKFENLTVWDTPGLGDGLARDQEIADEILLKLQEKDKKDRQLIDLVVVVMDASSKDLGSYYGLINDVLIPEFGDNARKRIVVALNQSDIAMKGTHWDNEKNEPDEVLEAFLKKKIASVRTRLRENTGLDLKPICYCAGYTHNGMQRKPYNLSKLLYYIVKAAPKAKKLNIADSLNTDSDNWAFNDKKMNYKFKIRKSFSDIVADCICEGMDDGADLGELVLGIPGIIIGATLGAVVGGVKGIFEGIASC